jgi:flagellar protein FliO/FliZ
MRLSALGLAIGLLLSVPLAAQTGANAPGLVVYPAASSAAPAAFVKEGPAGGVSPLFAVFIAACAGAGIWLWWRGRRGMPALSGRAERRLVVSETRSLGNRQFLVVAAYDDRRYLLGVCPGRIEMLAPLDPGSPPNLP